MPVLIHGLGAEQVYTRALCAEALREATGQHMDYNPSDDSYDREKAIERWERWWLARGGEGLLDG